MNIKSKVMMGTILLGAFFNALSPAQSQWDGDGGYTHDYSNIPRLEWRGSGQPDDYEDYLLKRGNLPFSAELAYSGGAYQKGQRALKALVLVETNLYAGILANLNVYVADLQSDGYTVEVYKTSGGTDRELKNFILKHSTDLFGVVLIGDHPAAWYKINPYDYFPCDLYYMELDGTWFDHNSDGMWDELQAGSGDEGPEIFIGRIDASMMTGDEAAITNHYLDKNHAYRTDAFLVPNFALTYTDDDWKNQLDLRTDIKHAYPVFDDIPGPDTLKFDYLNNRVTDTAYGFIQLACHSTDRRHEFARGGDCWNYEIHATDPFAVFWNFFCCGTLRWTTDDYLGGSYIYNTTTTSLAVIGSTKAGSMLVFHIFYKPFGKYETFGDSFRQWFNHLAPYDSDEILWHFGMTIAGDPFLKKRDAPLYFKFPQGLPDEFLPPGPETKLTFKIKEDTQGYVTGSGRLHYRFDSNDPFSELSVTHISGDIYEAVIPGASPGDEPEFYFSAQGDGGATVYSPYNAPADVYSFKVCFMDVLMEDDFEAAAGWTVENMNVVEGGFEWGSPQGTSAQPPVDHSVDGTLCYVTGKDAGTSVDSYDLDGGPTRLVSPVFDLSEGDASVEFYLWFHHSPLGTQQPQEIHLSNNGGTTWTHVADVEHYPGWNLFSYKVSDHVTPTDQMKIRFSAIDNPDDDVVEALVDDFAVVRYDYDPSLWADAYSMSVSEQAVIDFSLDAGSGHANRSYLLLGTLSGTSPGFLLPGGQKVPLNWDAFLNLILLNLNGPIFQNFMGTLDALGAATASFDTLGPVNPALVGLTANFAFVLGPPPAWDFASNVIPLTFEP